MVRRLLLVAVTALALVGVGASPALAECEEKVRTYTRWNGTKVTVKFRNCQGDSSSSNSPVVLFNGVPQPSSPNKPIHISTSGSVNSPGVSTRSSSSNSYTNTWSSSNSSSNSGSSGNSSSTSCSVTVNGVTNQC
jgi:hypothetical protein